MNSQEQKKNVPIYFYYLAISKQKDSNDSSVYDIQQIVAAFSDLLSYITQKSLNDRKKDITSSEKVVWLDSFEDLKNGNYNVIFKSAKYNHVRNEIDTETMTELGTRKRQKDGDEENTHLCVRLTKGQHRFLAVHESNHYGISINCIIDYLNTQFENYNEDSDDKYHYELSYEIMPGDDFIASLKDAKTTSALKLTVSKDVIKDDFMQFANRDEIDDEVEIWIKRPKGVKKFPDNLIKAYYDDLQSNNRIKKISVKGTKASGQFEVDTDLMKMKHYLSVSSEIITNEVNSVDFFVKAQEFIEEMRNKK